MSNGAVNPYPSLGFANPIRYPRSQAPLPSVFYTLEKHRQGAWAPWYVIRHHVHDVGCVVLLNQIIRDIYCLICFIVYLAETSRCIFKHDKKGKEDLENLTMTILEMFLDVARRSGC